MKRLIIALLLVIVFAPSARAEQTEPWRLQRFDAQLAIGRDGHVQVVETIEADFTEPRHGIFRYVPYQGKDDQGSPYELQISLKSTTRDGEQETVEATTANSNLVWKIGDPNRTLTGIHTYILTYDVIGAIRAFEGFDEIYWNVIGDDWGVPLPKATASVTLPEGVAVSQAACYTGSYGSTKTDCTSTVKDSVVSIASRLEQPLTLAIGFPKGAIAIPGPKPLPKSGYILILVWFVLLPLAVPTIAGIMLYRRWRKIGKDQKLGAITVQYDPPVDLRPAETHALMAQRSVRYDLPATIVDLAVRGFIKIEETKTEGLIKRKDHFLHLMKNYAQDVSIKPYERILLDSLFAGAQAPATARVSALANRTFRRQAERSFVAVSDGLAAADYFDPASHAARMKLLKRGAILLLLDALVLGPITFIVSPFLPFCIAATALLMIAFGWFMVRWTSKGRAAVEHARGYQLFIGAVEKYRAPWMETQEMFEKTLPYAMVFGLGSRWAKAFAALQMKPPTWYAAASHAAWTPVSFEKNLSSWATSVASLARSPSSRAGSGGGGFSGGGFGGGGGGSW